MSGWEPYPRGRSSTARCARSDLFDLRFDLPSRCATLLHEGASIWDDSSIEHLRGREPYRSCRPRDHVGRGCRLGRRVLARAAGGGADDWLDTSSRTSAGLTRVLCREAWGIDPVFETVRANAG
jgi:hypothetical protein